MKKLITLASLAFGLHALPAQASYVNYAGFADTTGLTTAGNAHTTSTGDGTVARLTNATTSQGGALYSTTALQLGSNATFSTTFQFRLSNAGGIAPADGFTFILANTDTGLGTVGGGLGLPANPNSVAIEFDTYNNGGGDGFSSNHVGLDLAGSTTSTYLQYVYGIASCGFGAGAGCLSNGDLWTATITYDGAKLNVTLLDPAKGTAFAAISDYAIDIASILGTEQAYVGFTSATGAGYETHDIVNWEFANTATLPTVPEPSSIALFGIAAAGFTAARRRKR